MKYRFPLFLSPFISSGLSTFIRTVLHRVERRLVLIILRHAGLLEIRTIPAKKDIAFVEFSDEGSATVAKDALHNFKIDGETKMKVGPGCILILIFMFVWTDPSPRSPTRGNEHQMRRLITGFVSRAGLGRYLALVCIVGHALRTRTNARCIGSTRSFTVSLTADRSRLDHSGRHTRLAHPSA